MSEPNRILVVKLGALGDLLLAEGALHDLRLHHPHAHISLLTRRPYAPWWQRCPWVDDVLIDEALPGWRLDALWRLRRRLRRASFERAYDLQNSSRSARYLRRLPGLGWNDPGSPWPRPRPIPKSLPVLQRHAAQLAAAGISPGHCLNPAADWLCEPVESLLDAAGIRPPFVLLLPGSSARHGEKRWPHYAALAARLQARGLLPVTVPGPEELGQLSHLPGVQRHAPDGRALALTALAGVMRHAAAVIGNDSGPTHLAASLGRPGLALFGTSPEHAARTCLQRRRMQVRAAPGFHGLNAEAIEADLLQLLHHQHSASDHSLPGTSTRPAPNAHLPVR